jgi:hypothetical protein
MKKNNILFFFEVCIYLVQIFFMLSFSKYMHSKILYNVFLFSLCYNILLVSFFLTTKHFYTKIIILNIFFCIAIYYFANIKLFGDREIVLIIKNISFNVMLFFIFSGNWLLAFIIRTFYELKNNIH